MGMRGIFRPLIVLYAAAALAAPAAALAADKAHPRPDSGGKTETAVLRIETKPRFAFRSTIRQALAPVPGIRSVEIPWDDTRVSVRFDPSLTKKSEIVHAIE